MGEFRRDPVSGRWVIIASDRPSKPTDFHVEKTLPSGGFCPFCEGNEDKTPNEIAALRDADSAPDRPGWRVRVVPNKFPALRVEGALDKRGDGMYDLMAGVGAHEVIIEHPQHVVSLSQMTDAAIQDVLTMYQNRLGDLSRDDRFLYGMIFKNMGSPAGATVDHSHSQLVVMPVVPRNVAVEMNCAAEFFRFRGRCLFCDMISQELATETRIVEQNSHFVALTPFASRFPFEMWIMPRTHSAHFETIAGGQAQALAGLLRVCLGKLEKALDMPPYNYIIHTGPFEGVNEDQYHWHIEIIPRILQLAGFEWGTGFYINPVAPESAAQYLRDTEV